MGVWPRVETLAGEFPFRLQIHAASESELETANELRRRAGAILFDDSRVERSRILSLRDPEPAQIEAWILHPDESVPVTLLRRRGQLVYDDLDCGYLLYQRAAAFAVSRRELWSPLLDAIAREALVWPEYESERYRDFAFVELEPVEAFADRVAVWVRQQDDVACALPLLAYKSSDVTAAVLRSLRCPGPAAVEAVCIRPALAEALAVNPTLREDTAESLYRWAFDRMETRRDVETFMLVHHVLEALHSQGFTPPPIGAAILLHAFDRAYLQDEIARIIEKVFPGELERPSIRDRLAAGSSAVALRALLPAASVAERADLLHRLFHLDPVMGVAETERYDAWTAVGLEERDLRVLLLPVVRAGGLAARWIEEILAGRQGSKSTAIVRANV